MVADGTRADMSYLAGMARKFSFERKPKPKSPASSPGPDPLLVTRANSMNMVVQRIDFGDGSAETAKIRAERRSSATAEEHDPSVNPDLAPQRKNSWRRRMARKLSYERKQKKKQDQPGSNGRDEGIAPARTSTVSSTSPPVADAAAAAVDPHAALRGASCWV